MNGYVLNLRLRRAGALGATERTLSVSDKELTRLGRQILFVLGVFLLALAPFAMAALTTPEKGDPPKRWFSDGGWN